MHTNRATIWQVSILNAYFSFFQIWLLKLQKMMNVRKFKSIMGSKSILLRIWICICIGFHEIFSSCLTLIFFDICCENSNMTSKRILPKHAWKQCGIWKQQQLKLGISVLKIKLVETKNVEFTSRNYILFKLSRYLFWMS